MTTINIIVVVALVFLITLCIIALKIWKKESEIRTDSFRAIERNLEILGYSMMDYLDLKSNGQETNNYKIAEEHNVPADNIGNGAINTLDNTLDNDIDNEANEQFHIDNSPININEIDRSIDRTIDQATEENVINPVTAGYEEEHEENYGEISLDFVDELEQSIKPMMGYDVGRSGKKYTAIELETLIKE